VLQPRLATRFEPAPVLATPNPLLLAASPFAEADLATPTENDLQEANVETTAPLTTVPAARPSALRVRPSRQRLTRPASEMAVARSVAPEDDGPAEETAADVDPALFVAAPVPFIKQPPIDSVEATTPATRTRAPATALYRDGVPVDLMPLAQPASQPQPRAPSSPLPYDSAPASGPPQVTLAPKRATFRGARGHPGLVASVQGDSELAAMVTPQRPLAVQTAIRPRPSSG